LEQVSAEIRGTLCRDVYDDIDIVNCQPTLLRQLASKYGRSLPVLDLYVSQREAFLEQLQTLMDWSRDVAKQEVLKVLYGGATSVAILYQLKTEIRDFGLFLGSTDEWSEVYGVASKDDRIGSCLAAVLQTEERRCLLAMNDYMLSKGWQPDVLSYDGFMVRKRTDATITPELLVDLEAAVKAATGYEIKLAIKPMANLLADAVIAEPAEDAYAVMKREFEKNHFYFIPTDTITEVTPEHGIHHFGLEHARNAFNTEEWILPNVKDDEQFIRRWIKDPHRRKVRQMVYKRPEDCKQDEASLFTGFAYELMTGEDPTAVELFLDLVSAICNDEEHVFKYVVKWFAHMIQYPFQIPGTALIFTSHTHGTGKDTVIDIMRRIIGRHSSIYTSETNFWDKHDTGKEGAILLHLQEAGAAANKAKSGELKALVTADKIRINPKGLRGYEVPNISRIVMTTNEADPLKLEESDRRFVLIRPSDRLHAKGEPWWRSIQDQIRSDAFLGTVGRWLWAHCLYEWSPRALPMTEVKADLLALSESPAKRFLEAMIEESGEFPHFITAKDLFLKYKTWAINEGTDNSVMFKSIATFGKGISPYKDKLFDHSHTKTGNLYRMRVPLTPAGGAGSEE
jgi:hypothetical protein